MEKLAEGFADTLKKFYDNNKDTINGALIGGAGGVGLGALSADVNENDSFSTALKKRLKAALIAGGLGATGGAGVGYVANKIGLKDQLKDAIKQTTQDSRHTNNQKGGVNADSPNVDLLAGATRVGAGSAGLWYGQGIGGSIADKKLAQADNIIKQQIADLTGNANTKPEDLQGLVNKVKTIDKISPDAKHRIIRKGQVTDSMFNTLSELAGTGGVHRTVFPNADGIAVTDNFLKKYDSTVGKTLNRKHHFVKSDLKHRGVGGVTGLALSSGLTELGLRALAQWDANKRAQQESQITNN